MKDKYNPFKMLGSYIGLVIAILLVWNIDLISCLNMCTNASGLDNLISNWWVLIAGFLVGWLVNSLWRKLK